MTKFAWPVEFAGYQVITRPYCDPVTLSEARKTLKFSDGNTAFDSTIGSLIRGASQAIAKYQRRSLVKTTYKMVNDDWLPEFNPLFPPLVSVTSIKYLDTAGTQQTLAADQYIVDNASEPGRISRAYGVAWPLLQGVQAQIEITYDAGYPEVTGALTAAKTGAVTQITLDGTTESLPPTGICYIKNATGQYETVNYQSYYENGGVYTLNVSTTLQNDYAEDDEIIILTVPETTRLAILALIVDMFEHPEANSEILLYANKSIMMIADLEAFERV